MEPRPQDDDIILLKSSEGETVYSSSKSWSDLEIPAEIITALELRNWIRPTLIQGIAISIIVSGQNLVAQSKNGSGKTGSFVIGSLCRVDKSSPELQIICISHTRELCQQNFSVFSEFGSRYGVSIGIVEKNTPTPKAQVLCITYGSLKKLSRPASNLKSLKVLIYDECDFLFTNEESKNTIMATQSIAPTAQKLLFSATFSDQVWKFAEDNIENAKSIKIEKREDLSLENVDQFVVQCERNKKFETVLEILRSVELKCCIIFLNTKDFLTKLEAFLSKNGYKVSKLASGIVSDEERNEIIKKVHEGAIKVLLTTDILSRGVDFRLVNIVINLDAPSIYVQNRAGPQTRQPDPLTYLHRIGRTGRYGRKGIAINIVADEESQRAYIAIQDFYGKRFKQIQVDKLAEEVERVNTDYAI